MAVQVTALVNSYLRVTYLPDALQSVVAQSSPDAFELVVVSPLPDWTLPARIEKQAEEIGVTVRRVTIPLGPEGDGLLRGISAARGEVISVLDDDDLWEAGKIRRVQEAFGENSRLTFFHNAQTFVDAQNQPLSWLNPHRLVRHPSSLLHPGLSRTLDGRDLQTARTIFRMDPGFNNSSISFRKSVLEAAYPYLARVSGSLDGFLLYCGLLSGGAIAATSDRLTRYRIHGEATTLGLEEGQGTMKRIDRYLNYLERQRQRVAISRSMEPNADAWLAPLVLGRDEAYFDLMEAAMAGDVSRARVTRAIRRIWRDDGLPPRVTSLLASFLGFGSLASASVTRSAFSAWRLAW